MATLRSSVRPVTRQADASIDTLRWNRQLSKAFDVTAETFPPRSAEEALVSRYLEVPIKLLEHRTQSVPSVRMGAWLTALDEILDTWSVDDIRNLNYHGEETPPHYDVIQLNSTRRSDFLIDGMRFLRQADEAARETRACLRVQPGWYGLQLTAYGLRTAGTAHELLAAIATKAKAINYLKGEAFSLSGEFLPKTDETFSDLFLEPANAQAIDRVVRLINTRGKALENRGVLLMGPPGTGKTLSARIVRNQAKATFIWVSARDFHYAGSFGGFSEAFDLAKECAPSVVVFEDVDNWLTERTVDFLKSEMDGVGRSTGIVTMMTTNYPELLPAALIDRPGRFHDVLKFDLPDATARGRMLEKWLPGLAAADRARAVTATDGYSGAHLRELARFTTIIKEQESLPLEQALRSALTKLAEQRALITATQTTGSRYRMPAPLAQKDGAALQRCAYSTLTIKRFDGATGRSFAGIATTPTPDRHGDIIDPLGVEFSNPLPLLLHHDLRQPVGVVQFSPPTADGIPFEATIPDVAEPGTVKESTDQAAHLVKYGLIRDVSIGFRPKAIQPLKGGAVRIAKCEVLELSLVSVAANMDAAITRVKSVAATGPNPPGVSGLAKKPPLMNPKQTTGEQITSWENSRAAKAARMSELMTQASDAGLTLDEAQSEEYDGLEREVKDIDTHLVRLRGLEKANVAAATPIGGSTGIKPASELRGGHIHVRSLVPPGTAFVRYCKALAASRGDSMAALAQAAQWRDSTPEVELYIKAAMAPATTTDATWAKPLVPSLQTVASEFIELLRPATILGKIPGLRRVPFNTSVPMQTGGGTYSWVGEGAPKPVTKLTFGTATLPMYKIAGILVFTEELARSSSPSAEQVFRDEMIAGIAQFMDAQFIDPAIALVAGVRPASITNGVAGIPATADPWDDINTLLGSFIAAGIPIAGVTLIMSEANAFRLSSDRLANGDPAFPTLTVNGGTINGVSVIASQAAGTNIIGLVPRYILYADDGGVTIDVSREASLQMDSAPMNPADATTVYRSLWQDNLVGLRAERFAAWVKAIAASVNMITGTAYPLAAPSE